MLWLIPVAPAVVPKAMPGQLLIDVTANRFLTANNSDVIEFIRRTNPFAHSDVGSMLFEYAKTIPGARAYCPAPTSYAYVVLHDEADRIVAIAFGQRGFGVRLRPASVDEAVADGAVRATDIGPNWVTFDPWDVSDKSRKQRIRHWTERAISEAGS
jgi:hypothetical protein